MVHYQGSACAGEIFGIDRHKSHSLSHQSHRPWAMVDPRTSYCDRFAYRTDRPKHRFASQRGVGNFRPRLKFQARTFTPHRLTVTTTSSPQRKEARREQGRSRHSQQQGRLLIITTGEFFLVLQGCKNAPAGRLLKPSGTSVLSQHDRFLLSASQQYRHQESQTPMCTEGGEFSFQTSCAHTVETLLTFLSGQQLLDHLLDEDRLGFRESSEGLVIATVSAQRFATMQ